MINNNLFGLTSHDFYRPYIHFSGEKITEFALMGQRCSGTNYIEHLIKKNFPSYFFNPTSSIETMPHKHHWPFLIPSRDYSFLKNNHCLFILIVRNPYEWIQSLFLHTALLSHQDRSSLYSFISTKCQYNLPWLYLPENENSFQNLLSARNCEINNFLAIGSKVANFLLVRYEDLSKDPANFVNFVAKYFNLIKTQSFVAIDSYKGGGKIPYSVKTYTPLGINDIEFINNNLAWDSEVSIGYFPTIDNEGRMPQ